MQDKLEMIYEQMLAPDIISEENAESIRHQLPKDVSRLLQEIKSLHLYGNLERDLDRKIDLLTFLLKKYIPRQEKQPVQIYHKGVRIK